MRKIALLVLAGTLFAACSSGVKAPSPTPGVLAGVVIGHTSQGGHQTPLEGARVGVFRRAVSSGGPVQENPPQPVATTTTDAHGTFSFHGLPAGRWFVVALDQAGGGTWVRFDPASGATVTLLVCTDCPVPL